MRLCNCAVAQARLHVSKLPLSSANYLRPAVLLLAEVPRLLGKGYLRAACWPLDMARCIYLDDEH